MTVINVAAALTALGGSAVVVSGHITVEYLRGTAKDPAVRGDGPTVTLPAPIVVAIANGAPVETFDVPPTDGTCYARLWIECTAPRDAGFLELAAVAIPANGPVDIADLVAVDPASYEPITTVVTAWQLAIDEADRIRTVIDARATEVATDRARAEDAAEGAGTFAEATEFDAGRAGNSAFEAGKSAAIALGHRNAAKTSEDAAAGSAGAAAASVMAANGERIGAGDERAGARQERQDAQAARAGAETARGGAETAQAGAVTARGGAETARTGAEQARDVALAGPFQGMNVLGGTDLNTLTTPGIYRATGGSGNTVELGWPFAGFIGVVQVVARQAPRATQIAYPTNGVNESDSRRYYIRTQFTSAWSTWKVYSAAAVNSPVTEPGLEFSMWDYVNSRQQPLTPTFVSLGTFDLNTVTLPGAYHQGNSASAQTARNYPVAERGILEVAHAAPVGAWFGSNTSFVLQRYTLLAGNARMRGIYERRGFLDNATTGAWAFEAWSFIPAQRVVAATDQPGIELRTWDDVNAREQRVSITDVALSSADLNAVLMDGTYRQSDSGMPTLARNYPAASVIGILRVSNTGNTVLQEYFPTAGPNAAKGFYLRRFIYSAGTFTSWVFTPSQRVDQTAGRAFYTWDEVNGRDQLVYGDTGWRALTTADLLSGWKITGHIRIRRINNMVFLRFSGIDGSEATADNIYQLPTGFRPEAQNRALPAVDNLTPVAIRFPSNGQVLMPNRTISLLTYAAELGPIITADPWPTALPGTASGGIPNA